jgi:GT2 family glycosyltransferase
MAKKTMKTSKERLIVVIGMHRSGTSCITRGLEVLGVGLGNNLMPAAPGDNEKGFFEDIDFNQLNIELLGHLGHDWDTLHPVSASELESELVTQFKNRAITLVHEKLNRTPVLGLKDPRATRLLPFWESVFKDCDLDASYILAIRNPVSVFESLRKRNGFSSLKSTYLWLEHIIPTIPLLQKRNTVIVEYENVLANPKKELTRMAEFLELAKPDSKKLAKYENEFLDLNLQHQKFIDLSGLEFEINLVKSAYDLLHLLSSKETQASAGQVSRKLSSLQKAFDLITPQLSLEARRETQSKINDLKNSNSLGLSKIENLGQFSKELKNKLSIQQQEFSSLQKVLIERSEWASSLNIELEKFQLLLKAQQKETRDANRWGKSLDKQLKDRTKWAKNLELELKTTRKEFELLQGDFLEKLDWANSLNTELEKTNILLVGEQRETQNALRWGTNLNEQLDRRTEWAQKLESEIETNRQQFERLEKGFNERTDWAQKLESEIETNRQQFERLEKGFNERTDWAIALDKELENSKSLVASEQREKGIIIQRARELESAQEEAKRNLAELALSLDSALLEKQFLLTSKNQEIENLHQLALENDQQFQLTLDQYTQALVDLKSSTSWRFTWPIRATKERLSRAVKFIKVNVLGFPRGLPIGAKTKAHLQTILYTRNFLSTTQAYELWKSRWDYLLGDDNWETLPALSKSPRVSIIIPVYGQLEYTLQCLRSIFLAPESCQHEIILVDDCSPDDSYETLLKLSGVRLYRNNENLGFIRTCNYGASLARGELLLFLNNDTEVSPNWLDSIISIFDSRDDAGVVGSKLVYPNGRLQEAGGILWSDGSAWNFGHSQDPDSPAFNYVKEVDYCSGASFAMPSTLFKELGGFDENYLPAYCEDSDLCMKVRAAGYKVYFQPFSRIKHFEGISNGTDITHSIKAYQVDNQKKLHERWRSVWNEENFRSAEHVFLARERSKNKSLILVIDQFVPQSDKNIHSKMMSRFIDAFQENDLIVKFWPADLQYDPVDTKRLQEKGIETFYGDEYADFGDWCKNHLGYFDYIFLGHSSTAEAKLSTLLVSKRAETQLIFYDPERRQLSAEYPKINEPQDQYIWENMDLSLFSSRDEAEYVGRLNGNGSTSSIQPYCFDNFPPSASLVPGNREGILYRANFEDPGNSGSSTWLIREIMPRVWDKLPDAKLYLVSDTLPEQVRSQASSRLEIVEGITQEELSKYYSSCKIAVAPIQKGSGLKYQVIESLANGIPLVTTPVGAQGVNDPARFVCVTDEIDKFVDSMILLYESDELWNEYSHSSLEYAMENFSRKSLAIGWQNIFQDLAQSGELKNTG